MRRSLDRRRFASLVVGVLLVVTCSCVGRAEPASASAYGMGCNPPPPNPPRNNDFAFHRFAGMYHHIAGVTEVSSHIIDYSPYVGLPNNGIDNSVSAWTMMQDGFHYAQAGWLEAYGGQRHTFAEWRIDVYPYYYRVLLDPPVLGPYPVYSYYSVHFINGTAYYNIDSTQITTGPILFTPNEADAMGETHSFDDQMAGGLHDPEDFAQSAVKANGQVQNFNGTAYDQDQNGKNLNGTFYAVVYSPTDAQTSDASCPY
jgi:hypothetical protein